MRRGHLLLALAVLGLTTTTAHATTTSFSAAIYSYDGAATSAQGGLTSVRLSFVRTAANARNALARQSANRRLGTSNAAKAGTGGINAVRLDQVGEDAVRAAYNIGDKVPIRGSRTLPR